MLDAGVVISELMANNALGLLDYHDDASDWLEITNRGLSHVDLGGWYLSDDLGNPALWQFPVSAELAPDERLVVFASGKDFVAHDGELHTNFRLSASGESLILSDSESMLVHRIDFPAQARDVSYALVENETTFLVPPGAEAKALLPTEGSLAQTWTGGDEPFDDAVWISGTTGVGYDTLQIGGALSPPLSYWTFETFAEAGSVAPDEMGRYAAQVSGGTLTSGGGGRFGEALSLDGDGDYASAGIVSELVSPAEFSVSLWFQRTADHAATSQSTNHAVNNVLVAQSSGNTNDNLEIGTVNDTVQVYLDTEQLGGAAPAIWEQASLVNNTWHHLVMTYDSSDLFELKLYVDGSLVGQHDRWGGNLTGSGTSPLTFGLARPDTSAWGDFEGLIDDIAIWTEVLDAEHVSALFAGTSPLRLSGYADLIGLDLSAEAARGATTSAYVRIPFVVEDPLAIETLSLRVRYDDALVAYVNGTEVARANVTGTLQWDSVADSDRPDAAAFKPQEFRFANASGLLRAGSNVLAVQGLSRTADAARWLVLPELTADLAPMQIGSFVDTPTPGQANLSGFAGLMQPPTFSVPSGTFIEDFALELTADQAGSQIRYTTDLSVPDETSLPYVTAIPVSATTQIRARVFRPDSVPSEVVSQSYVRIDSELESFSSNLPLLLLDTLGQGLPGRDFTNSFLAAFEPDETGQSRLTNPTDLSSRMGMHRQGNTSFSWPKPGYRIETRNEVNRDRAVELFGLPAESDWALKGPYKQDRSLIRNAFVYELDRQLGNYSPRTRFVEVFASFSGPSVTLNDYRGVYVLAETIKPDKNRVDIERLSSKQNAEPEITGGYMFKIDPVRQNGGAFSTPHTPDVDGNPLVLFEPHALQVTEEQKDFIRNYVIQFEDALYSPNFTDPATGYRAYVDVHSVVERHILFTLVMRPTNHSTYFYKDRGGKLTFGPLWDYNQSLGGSGDSLPPESFLGQFSCPVCNIHWFNRMFDDPDFGQRWVDRWQELRNTFLTNDNFAALIRGMATELVEPQERNFARWPTVAPDGGPFAEPGLSDWEGELSDMQGWLSRKLNWIDEKLLPPVSFSSTMTSVDSGFEVTLAVPEGSIYYTLDGSDPRAAGGGVSPHAIEYTGTPLMINDTARIIARTFDPTAGPVQNFASRQWSSAVARELVVQGLVLTELNYNPHGADPRRSELNTDNDDFEFVELANTGSDPIELGGSQLVQVDVGGDRQGIEFHFSSGTLQPGEQLVVVKNRVAFESRFGTSVRIADGDDGMGGNNGEYGNQLANNGERITLLDPQGITLVSFDFDDGTKWPQRADGAGSSLELIDLSLDPNDPTSWRASIERGGSPGTVGMGSVLGVVVNELLTDTPGALSDAIELFNPTGISIDLGGMWLSDTLGNLDRYEFPEKTIVPAGGFLVLDEDEFGFGLNGNEGEDIVLVQPGAFPHSDLFIDHVSFGPALPGESFGRWPDSNTNLFPMISTTFGAANSGPRVGPVVISEVMFNPAVGQGERSKFSAIFSDDKRLDFIEIYNPTGASVDLNGWTLDEIGYTFSGNTVINPGQVIVIVPFDPALDATSVAAFETAHGVNISANPSRYKGPYSRQLDDSVQRLTLHRAAGDPIEGDVAMFPLVIEDEITYDNTTRLTTMVDGTAVSLQRRRVDLWGHDPNNWVEDLPTPGRFEFVKFVVFNASPMIGEVGLISNLTHQSQTINLSQTYENPVVFAKPASLHGADPVIVRVDDVQSSQFNLYLVEPSNLNGVHNVAERVSYLVLESGSHWLADGTHLEVGTIATNATVGHQVPLPTWDSVEFVHQFTDVPAVLSQPQTIFGETYLETRQNKIASTGFDVALEQEEQVAVQHGTEIVGYLAIDQGLGTWDGRQYEAKLTHPRFKGDNRFTIERFQQSFNASP